MHKKYSVANAEKLFLQSFKIKRGVPEESGESVDTEMYQVFKFELFISREVSEWLKEHAWKVCIRETVSRVRIPSSLHRPPKLQQRRAFLCPTDKNYLTQTNCNIRVVEGVPSTREKLCIRETVSRPYPHLPHFMAIVQ
jgi:hypothetical protein